MEYNTGLKSVKIQKTLNRNLSNDAELQYSNIFLIHKRLTLFAYTNQSADLQGMSIDWFLCEGNIDR